jgi:D-alanyl-D-alanine carboxypeptidase/D-alanyl-D-alanine-endopeptidase (penicillin-binding protein 4)
MKNTPAENIVHAKTGTLRYVRSLSGYVKSKDDEEFIVSILINHYTTPERTSADIQDKIMILLANFSRGK